MKEEIRGLHQIRGDYDKPSSYRNWNSFKLPEKDRRPLDQKALR